MLYALIFILIMHQYNASGCEQTSSPKISSTDNSAKIPQNSALTGSNWSFVLSSLPSDWILTPVKDKRPLRPDWQHEAAIARDELLELLINGQKLISSKGKEWHCHWTGIGLRLGIISGGVMAIDCDGELAEAKLQEISGGDIPLTPCWTSGKEGRRQLLYQIPPEHWEKVKTVKIDCKEDNYLEFRWDGCQSVLPPSKHPETGQYYWVASPQDTEVAIAPNWLLEFIEAHTHHSASDNDSPSLPLTTNPQSSSNFSASSQWTEIEWARSYLNALASWRAEHYDEWLKVGMALHSISDSLLIDWDDWSRQSSKYQPGVCERKWRSFQPTKGIGIGSLGEWAKEDGWQSPFRKSQKSKVKSQNSLSSATKVEKSTVGNSSSHLPSDTATALNETQETIKQAITRLILEGIQGSDRQLAIFNLSCLYHVPSQQLERLWQQVEQELEDEQIKPDIVNKVRNHLHNRNYRLDAFKIFPENLASLLTRCANAFPGPVEGLIVPLLGVSAGCVGTAAEVVIKQSSGYKQPCLIRTLLLGETGEMKTPLMNIITTPLYRREKEALQRYKQDLKVYEALVEGGDKSAVCPQRERFALMDATPEETIRVHATSPKGFTFVHDEWGAYVNSFNKYRNGVGNDREMDLTEFNGGTYIRDRVNDESLFIEKTAISRVAGYQLSLMYALIEKLDDQDGFLNRWMMAAPPFPPAYKDFINDDSRETYELQLLLYELYGGLRRLPTGTYLLSLEARRILQTWQHHLTDLTQDETNISLKGLYAKLESYTARFALILHLIDAVLAERHPHPTISGATMEKAVYLAQYFLSQARWIYCRKDANTEGLSGMLAQIQEFCLKKGGTIAARSVKMAISSIKKSAKASTAFIREQFKQLAEMGCGVLEGCGIHLRYRALSTNQQNPPPPPSSPPLSRDIGYLENVDTPHQHLSTSTNLQDIHIVAMKVSIDGLTLRGMGGFLDTGEISIRLSNGSILTVPPEQCECVDGDDFVDVGQNVDTPINTLEVNHHQAFEENVDVLMESGSQKITDEITVNSDDHLTYPSSSVGYEDEDCESSPNWETFPMRNCRSPQEIALELKETLMQCYREGQIIEALQLFSREAIAWGVNHLIEPTQRPWFENLIEEI